MSENVQGQTLVFKPFELPISMNLSGDAPKHYLASEGMISRAAYFTVMDPSKLEGEALEALKRPLVGETLRNILLYCNKLTQNMNDADRTPFYEIGENSVAINLSGFGGFRLLTTTEWDFAFSGKAQLLKKLFPDGDKTKVHTLPLESLDGEIKEAVMGFVDVEPDVLSFELLSRDMEGALNSRLSEPLKLEEFKITLALDEPLNYGFRIGLFCNAIGE